MHILGRVHDDRLSDRMKTQIGIKIETEWSSSPALNGHMVTHHWETHYFTVFGFITLASRGHSTKIATQNCSSSRDLQFVSVPATDLALICKTDWLFNQAVVSYPGFGQS